jgi:hypothetical protein
MHQHRRHRHPPDVTDCPRRRLAQGDLAAVDACGCGMLQVHIGALTLRLAPCALEELASTLNDAVAAHDRRFAAAETSPATLGHLPRQRGKA